MRGSTIPSFWMFVSRGQGLPGGILALLIICISDCLLYPVHDYLLWKLASRMHLLGHFRSTDIQSSSITGPCAHRELPGQVSQGCCVQESKEDWFL
jgi:hypothetical protein